eukprot:jgi/Galph1/232/GphlegSOOS_G4910.1
MAKSKRSKVKQVYRRIAKEKLEQRELERLKKTCLSLHKLAELHQTPVARVSRRKIQHGGFEPITSYTPTPIRPRKYAVHTVENGQYVQRDPSVILEEEKAQTLEDNNVDMQKVDYFYRDVTKHTITKATINADEATYISYFRATEKGKL